MTLKGREATNGSVGVIVETPRSAVRLHVPAGVRSERVGGGPKNHHLQTHDAARLHQYDSNTFNQMC